MITEDYVNFDTAKLLKEKGFDDSFVPVNYGFNVYDKDTGKLLINNPLNSILAPTLQMAMKWLREVHDKSIEIRSQGLKATGIGWVVEIYNLRNQDEEYHHPYTFPTYEQACETAIKYCLEKLI